MVWAHAALGNNVPAWITVMGHGSIILILTLLQICLGRYVDIGKIHFLTKVLYSDCSEGKNHGTVFQIDFHSMYHRTYIMDSSRF